MNESKILDPLVNSILKNISENSIYEYSAIEKVYLKTKSFDAVLFYMYFCSSIASNLDVVEINGHRLKELGFLRDPLPFENKISLPKSPSGDFDGAIKYKYKGEYKHCIFFHQNKFWYEVFTYEDEYGDHIYAKPIVFIHELMLFMGQELTIKEKV